MEEIKSHSLVKIAGSLRMAGISRRHNIAVMNTKLKLMRLVMAATFGSLLWAGCSSTGPSTSGSTLSMQSEAGPANLINRRPDTHPEWKSGLAVSRTVVEVPGEFTTDVVVVDEAAGARR
ncbi:MAG: hypothetical protein ABIV39_07465 [Verrucomicrobiota bacterium]